MVFRTYKQLYGAFFYVFLENTLKFKILKTLTI